MARPLGSKNKAANVRAIVNKLARGGTVNLERCFAALQAIVDNPKETAFARIAAARELFNRSFGLPRATLDVEHGLGESAVELLTRIATSDRHRAALESLERERAQRRLGSIPIQKENA